MRSFAQQVCHQLDCHRRTNVVCVRFECEAPDCNPLFPQHPQRFPDRLQKTLFLSIVYALHFLKQIERSAKSLADRNERSDVFGKTGTAVSNSRLKKIAPDPMIHSNSVGDFFDIGAAGLANRRDRVDIGNFQGQK